jgi:hypothetical protein
LIADPLLERAAVAVLLELLPGLEDVPGHLEPVESERFLGADTEVGVKGEVAAQMRPAALPPFRLETVVGAEAIGADDATELVADQSVQVLFAAVGRDPQHRRLFAEGAPERARLAAEVPAGLVDIECARRTRLLEQLLVDRLQRLADAGEDRVDRGLPRSGSRTTPPSARRAVGARSGYAPIGRTEGEVSTC